MALRATTPRPGGRSVVAFMAVHPPRLAGTRLRLTQHFPYLEEQGLSCELWTFLSEEDLPRWYGRSSLARVLVTLKSLLRVPRALLLIRRSDVVIVYRACLPLGPPILEWLASRTKPIVWDVDDYVWRRYTSPTSGRVSRWLRSSQRKHESICRWAAEVWAGSAPIREWAEAINPRVFHLPTVVHVPDERPDSERSRSAGWVGSHSTAPFVEAILPHLGPCKSLEYVTVVGGAVASSSSSPVVKQESWSPSSERRVCESSRVGLYPIDRDNPYAEGKCGLKAILYMAHGLPCVVTPTRPNRAIVRNGIDGLYADSPQEWCDAVERLLADEELWEQCSREGYERVREEFSLQVWGPRVAQRVLALLGRSQRRGPLDTK